MTYSASRLTLYAILSGIEDDLRALILLYLTNTRPVPELLGQEVFSRALERYLKDQGRHEGDVSLRELLPFLDFADSYVLLNTHGASLPSAVAAYLKEITPILEQLAPIRNRVAHGRPLMFDDLSRTLDVAEEFVTTTSVNWENLKTVFSKLKSEPSFVLGLTIPTFTDAADRRDNLPTPDFDETGFLGRAQQVDDLIKLCLGPYPVITIFAEGGVGKTALAQKVAYDILDREDHPFEYIVWTSSKVAQLTAQEVVRIKDAITDSLGLFHSVAEHLSGKPQPDPVDEVINYMTEFRILLIMDNLETVLDDRIRGFLQRLPKGSKVIITSRIGLGAFEYPYKLVAMEPDEGVQLLRALAKVRGLSGLVRVPNKKVREYCNRMKNNPGWIKWFVSAVQAGKRPEEVLEKPHIFLDFCMTNVYEYLSEESKNVLRSMLCVPGAHSQAELAFLNTMDSVALQRALQLLLTTNFIVMTSLPAGSSFESSYSLSELARVFLAKHHPAKPAEATHFNKRRKQLIAAGEQIKAGSTKDPFSYQSITTRSHSDLVVARYLLDALDLSMRRLFESAEKAIANAKSLAPEYFEVHRVEAIVKASQENYPAAQDAYEAAIELEPRSAPLRLWYAGFLLRYQDDTEAALRHLGIARELAPASSEVELETARALMFVSKFEQAEKILGHLSGQFDALSEWARRKVFDLTLSLHQRCADFHMQQRDSMSALRELEVLRAVYDGIPVTTVDDRMRVKVGKTLPTAASCVEHIDDPDSRLRAIEMLRWVKEVGGRFYRHETAPRGKPVTPSREGRLHGEVVRLQAAFGFIRGQDGNTIFFHRTAMDTRSQWRQVRVGMEVEYQLGIDNGRPCGLHVRLRPSR